MDIRYGQALKLSVAYQGGIVVWVAFWAFYGQGVGAENLSQVLAFGSAYMSVVIIEPLLDLGLLAAAKFLNGLRNTMFVEKRLYSGSQA